MHKLYKKLSKWNCSIVWRVRRKKSDYSINVLAWYLAHIMPTNLLANLLWCMRLAFLFILSHFLVSFFSSYLFLFSRQLSSTYSCSFSRSLFAFFCLSLSLLLLFLLIPPASPASLPTLRPLPLLHSSPRQRHHQISVAGEINDGNMVYSQSLKIWTNSIDDENAFISCYLFGWTKMRKIQTKWKHNNREMITWKLNHRKSEL